MQKSKIKPKKLLILSIIGIITIILAIFLINYTAILQAPQIKTGAKLELDSNNISKSVDYKYTSVASNLYVPWSIVFPTKDSMYIAQRSGEILYYKNSQPQANFYKFSEISIVARETRLIQDIEIGLKSFALTITHCYKCKVQSNFKINFF